MVSTIPMIVAVVISLALCEETKSKRPSVDTLPSSPNIVSRKHMNSPDSPRLIRVLRQIAQPSASDIITPRSRSAHASPSFDTALSTDLSNFPDQQRVFSDVQTERNTAIDKGFIEVKRDNEEGSDLPSGSGLDQERVVSRNVSVVRNDDDDTMSRNSGDNVELVIDSAEPLPSNGDSIQRQTGTTLSTIYTELNTDRHDTGSHNPSDDGRSESTGSHLMSGDTYHVTNGGGEDEMAVRNGSVNGRDTIREDITMLFHDSPGTNFSDRSVLQRQDTNVSNVQAVSVATSSSNGETHLFGHSDSSVDHNNSVNNEDEGNRSYPPTKGEDELNLPTGSTFGASSTATAGIHLVDSVSTIHSTPDTLYDGTFTPLTTVPSSSSTSSPDGGHPVEPTHQNNEDQGEGRDREYEGKDDPTSTATTNQESTLSDNNNLRSTSSSSFISSSLPSSTTSSATVPVTTIHTTAEPITVTTTSTRRMPEKDFTTPFIPPITDHEPEVTAAATAEGGQSTTTTPPNSLTTITQATQLTYAAGTGGHVLPTSLAPPADQHSHDENNNNNVPSGGVTVTTSGSAISDQGLGSASSYIQLKFNITWSMFCDRTIVIRGKLFESLHNRTGLEDLTEDQIQMEQDKCYGNETSATGEILVHMIIVNKTHHFDPRLTQVCAEFLEYAFSQGTTSLINDTRLWVTFHDGAPNSSHNSLISAKNNENSTDSGLDPRVTIAVSIAVIGGCCCIGLIILQICVRRKKAENRVVFPLNRTYSVTSADTFQLSSVIKSRPNSGLYNPGLDLLDPPDPTHPLSYVQFSNFCMDEAKIADEYMKLPQRMPRPSMVPAGEEDKNRYANILPLVHTRVKLLQDGPDVRSAYINANYVTGPNNQCQYYIATQAPTETTINDFWTMVWQQNCKVIVMLTQLEEQGQPKCASYWPELVGKSASQKYGDFLIELKQKDVHQEYIVSKLEINNLRKIETRQIEHFWYTCWPAEGVPEPISLVKLVIDVRPKYENGSSPLLVHCSPGTGRTCTFIALDLCMRQFETVRMVDVMKTVHVIRQERAGAIQNKEQYILLYNAIHEYAAIVMTPSMGAAASSAATLRALLPS